MELRSKSQREAAGPDVADRDLSGEAVIRLAHDPSPPILSPVRLQTTPVLSDSNTDDAEQRQEHAHTTPESGTLTLKSSYLTKCNVLLSYSVYANCVVGHWQRTVQVTNRQGGETTKSGAKCSMS